VVELVGLRVIVDRRDNCHANVAIVRAGEGGTYSLQCEECNSSRGILPEAAVDFLRSTVRLFGTPSAPIFISSAIAQKGANKMNRNDLFPSKYFKAADLGGKPTTLVIKATSVEAMKNMNGGTDDKLVVTFVNQTKGLVVNRTNYDAIADLHGDETDNWAGQRVELYPSKASVGGRSVDCVRVRAPVGDALNDAIGF
jgi:hypothetical protein